MKRFIYVLVIFLLGLGVGHVYEHYDVSGSRKDEKEVSAVVEQAFQKAGIYDSECEVEGYFYLGPMYLSDDSCQEMLGRLASLLGVDSAYEYRRDQTDLGFMAVLAKEAEDSTLELKLITAEYEENKNLISQRQYLSARLTISNSINSAFYYRRLLAQGMQKLMAGIEKKYGQTRYDDESVRQLVDQINVSVRGKIYGYMSLEKQKELAQELASGVGAGFVFEHVEEGEAASAYSYYGYTDEIDDYVSVGSDRINYNIAFSIDEDSHTTCIHIGTPIVNYDY